MPKGGLEQIYFRTQYHQNEPKNWLNNMKLQCTSTLYLYKNQCCVMKMMYTTKRGKKKKRKKEATLYPGRDGLMPCQKLNSFFINGLPPKYRATLFCFQTKVFSQPLIITTCTQQKPLIGMENRLTLNEFVSTTLT